MACYFVVLVLALCGTVWCNSHGDGRGLFTQYNANHDSCLGQDEFSKIFMDFDSWPKDHQISRAEFSNAWTTDHLQDQDNVPFYFELVDHSPRDNHITQTELTMLYNSVFDPTGQGCVSSRNFESLWMALFTTKSGDD